MKLVLAFLASVFFASAFYWQQRAHECEEWSFTMRRQAEFFRGLYIQASAESKLTDCVELDSNYIVCQKARHGEKR